MVNINKIKTTVIKTANKALDVTNEVGKSAKEFAYYASDKIGEKKDKFIKSDKLNKDTAVGGAVVLGALKLSKDCVQGIVDKVKEIKDKED